MTKPNQFPSWVFVLFVFLVCLVLFVMAQEVHPKKHLPTQKHFEVPEIPVPTEET